MHQIYKYSIFLILSITFYTKIFPQLLKKDSKYKSFHISLKDFKTIHFHQKPVYQGNTGTCWAFAAISFVESEIKRLTSKEIKLSEMYLVYWEYYEKTMQYLKDRGETYFVEGSEANAIKRWLDKYGLVPNEVYSGKTNNSLIYDHKNLFNELKNYLDSIKKVCFWNDKIIEKTILSILNKHIGEPPENFIFQGKLYTPITFREQFFPIKQSDIVNFVSFVNEPYHQKILLNEKDNWWHSNDYYNIPLEDFFTTLKYALENGYTVCMCGDITEPTWNEANQISYVEKYDIPSQFINEYSRFFRWYNNSTTNDHCVHVVGITKKDKKHWFLLKDSGMSFYHKENKGYHFVNEDYIKLKMITLMLHKDGAPILDKIIK